MFGQVPSLQHLRVFGSLCYATDPKILDKFAPRVVPAVHMGYSMNKKGYILYNLTCKSFFISRDAVFKEDIFPFKNLKSFPDHLFPVLDLHDSSYIESTSDNASIQGSNPTTSIQPQTSSNITALLVPLRRSSRQSKPPIWLDSYVTYSAQNACLYPMLQYVSYSKLTVSL